MFYKGIIARKSEQDRRLTSQASRFWTEILFSESLSLIAEQQNSINSNFDTSSLLQQQEPNFDRYEKECDIIKKFTLKEFQIFANQLLSLSPSSSKVNRRLLISQINSSKKSVTGGSSSISSPQTKNNLKYIDIIAEKGPISTETI